MTDIQLFCYTIRQHKLVLETISCPVSLLHCAGTSNANMYDILQFSIYNRDNRDIYLGVYMYTSNK